MHGRAIGAMSGGACRAVRGSGGRGGGVSGDWFSWWEALAQDAAATGAVQNWLRGKAHNQILKSY